MARNRSGLHDRRGFDGIIQLCLVMIVVSLLFLILVNWKIGLALTMYFCVSFIVVESMSAPPANRPDVFVPWVRMQPGRKPTLLCFGDSITHGVVSSSYTPIIPVKLSERLGLEPPKPRIFSDPVWVVNAGQNGITSHVILHERMNKALACYPDYITIMIGTNDVLSQCDKTLSGLIVGQNELPEVPTMQVYERNLRGIVSHIRQASPKVHIGICTLPPITENLNSRPNQMVREANAVIERVAATDEDATVIPVFERLEAVLEKSRKRSWMGLGPLHYVAFLVQNYLFHCLGFVFSWNMLGSIFGQTLLPDAIHLNDTASSIVVDAIVDWLLEKNVAKAIAVKSM